MSLDSFPNETIALIAQYLDAPGLFSLILSAKRFYLHSILWERLYVEKVASDEERYGWPFSLVVSAMGNQPVAFKGMLAHADDDWVNKMVIPVESLPYSTSDVWKGLNYKPWIRCKTTLFHVAYQLGNKKIIDLLLSKGADPSNNDNRGFTPLHLAAAKDDVASMQMLISAGAAVHAWTAHDLLNDHPAMAPFHLALKDNKIFAVKFLIDSGAVSRDSPEFSHPRALVVLGSTSMECIHHLLNLGLHNEALNWALFYAVCCGDEQRAKVFLDAGAKATFQSLAAALQRDETSMIRLLLHDGLDLCTTDRRGNGLLYYIRSQEVAQKLLNEDPNLATTGTTGLLSFLRYENMVDDILSLTVLLINRGCGVDCATVRWAADEGHASVLEAIQRNQKELEGLSKRECDDILQVAASSSSEQKQECVMRLIELGCDINATSDWGATVLFRLFDFSETLCESVFGPLVKYLINAGIDVSARTEFGQTALHEAIRSNTVWAADLLLEAGADISLPDDDGETALHAAALSGNADLVEKIIQKGACTSARTKKGDTILRRAIKGALALHSRDTDYGKMLACIVLGFEDAAGQIELAVWSESGHAEMIRWLIREGHADLSMRDGMGNAVFEDIKRVHYNVDWTFLERSAALGIKGCKELTTHIVEWAIDQDVTAGFTGLKDAKKLLDRMHFI